MVPKFMTTKGSSTLTSKTYYIGVVQHERSMNKREAYEYFAEETKYSQAAIRATFKALKELMRENSRKGNSTTVDEVASARNRCKGAFFGSTGPWVKGVNYLETGVQTLDPFRNALSSKIPENRTEGANPIINTVLDETTGEYGEITGTDTFSIAGSDLGPDSTKTDEYVALANAADVETRCTITYSDLQNVKAKLASALTAGDYTLKVYTRSGLGSEFGVKCATRKVTVK